MNFAGLAERTEAFRAQFSIGIPTRYFVADRFLEDAVAREAMNSFPSYDEMEKKRDSVVEKRASETRLHLVAPVYKTIFDALYSAEFVAWLEAVTGITELSPSESMDGGGLHQSLDGGFHNIHVDKNRDPVRGYYHRLSLIVYLNEGWTIGSPGALELWDCELKHCVEKIQPLLNHCIIFEVNDAAYHGYSRLSLPPGAARKSLAMWYLSPHRGTRQTEKPRGATFALRPTDASGLKVKHYLREIYHKGPQPLRVVLKAMKELAKR